MEYILIIKNGKFVFRDAEYDFIDYEIIDDDSLMMNLDNQYICFYYYDTTINEQTFSSLVEFTTFLDGYKKNKILKKT